MSENELIISCDGVDVEGPWQLSYLQKGALQKKHALSFLSFLKLLFL